MATAGLSILLIGGASPPATAPPSCASAGPTARSCWSGASRSRRTSGRRSRRSTCAARPSGRTPTSTRSSWYEENGVELRTGTNVMSLDRGGADGEAAGRGGGRLREGADRHRARTSTSCGSRARAQEGIHYLRAFGNSDAIRADAEGGRAGGADRRQLHRLRGRGVADSEGDRLRDRDDGGRGALADLRRGGGALVPRAARVEGGRDPRRRDARGLRGRRRRRGRW